jgi:hypothetical protein
MNIYLPETEAVQLLRGLVQHSAGQLRLLLCLLGLLLIHRFNWVGLRGFTSEAVLRFSGCLGMTMVRVNTTALLYKNVLHEFTTACTFIDIFTVLVFLSWQTKRPLSYNLARYAPLAGSLAILNIIRIEMNLFLFSQYFPRWLYHDLVDGAFYFFALAWIMKKSNPLSPSLLTNIELNASSPSLM